jgi:rhamnulose-1-phosphate aldolase
MSNISLPSLDDLLETIGQSGYRMAEIGASEGAAGNLSVCICWPVQVQDRFPLEKEMQLPQVVPQLAGATIIVSGSGRRLREIKDDPTAHLACIRVQAGGKTGVMYTSDRSRFERVTSEFNSHLAVHADRLNCTDTTFHTIVHAQPLHLTYLSHIPRYQEWQYLNSHLLRWQPETILNMPEGIGFIPFCVPGSDVLMSDNVEMLRTHRIVVWAKHGVMARSDVSIKRAADLVEYAEAAAKYEYLNLCAGEIANGLNVEEIREICKSFNVKQEIF